MADSSAITQLQDELAKMVLRRSELTSVIPVYELQIQQANQILNNEPTKYSTATVTHNGAETSRGGLQNWVDQINQANISAKAELKLVKESITELNKSILDLKAADLFSSNPTLALEQQKIASQAEADKIKAQAEASLLSSTKLFAQKNTQYIIIGVVIVAVGLTAFILYKKFSK